MTTGIPSAPDTLSGHLGQLERLFDSVAGVTHHPRSSWDVPPQGGYPVITIGGSRGAGKTTLLKLFASALSTRDNVVVLPPLEPEMFGATDNVFGAVIARLQRLLEHRNSSALSEVNVKLPTQEGERNVAQALDRLLRHTALVHDAGDAGKVTTSSLEQYSSDFAKHALIGESFTELWDVTVMACCRALSKDPGSSPVLLVPIDDPDLAPHVLSSVLQDVRVLARTPQVVVCVCLDIPEARRALSAGYISSLGLRPDHHAAYAVVEAQLSKALPHQLRVGLTEQTPAERLQFVPFGSDGLPLGDLLQRFAVPSQHGPFAIGDLLYLQDSNGRRQPSPYADCLPALPRELQNLYYLLDALADTDGSPDVHGAVKVLLESAVSAGFQRGPNPQIDPERLIRIMRSLDPNEKPLMSIDLGPIAYARGWKAETLILHIEGADQDIVIDVGSMGAVMGRVERSDDEDRQYLDPALTLAPLLAREFTEHGELFDEDLTGGEPISGGREGALLNIRVGSMTGDRYFLVLPRWKTFFDYFAFDLAWRTSVARTSEVASENSDEHQALVAGLVITCIRVVAETQLNRNPKAIGTDALRRLTRPEEREECLLEEWAVAESALLAAAANSTDCSRDLIFQRWIADFLPMACHPWLIPQWLIDKILATRTETTGSTEGDSELLRLLQQRVRANLGDEWVTPILGVFDSYGDLVSVALSHQQACEQREQYAGSALLVPEKSLPEVDPATLARHAMQILADMRGEVERDIERN